MEEDMDGSLFEGMVLFTPSDLSPPPPPPPPPPPSDGHVSSPPPSLDAHSQPLDEDLFSDLTLQTPPNPVDPAPISLPPSFPVTNTITSSSPEALHPPPSRQTSRKKKRAVRIGYARDAAADEPDHQLPDPLHMPPPPPSSVIAAASKSAHSTILEPPPPSCGDLNTNYVSSIAEPGLPPAPYPGKPTDQSGDEIADLSSQDAISNDEDRACVEPEAVHSSTKGAADKEDALGSVEERLELARLRISEKLDALRQRAVSMSAERKELERRRRKAAEDLDSASTRYRDLEKELEEACETEDFERAEKVSESLAAAEKDKDKHLVILRDAELNWESTESKMQEILELQIAAEEEAATLLERLAKDTADHGDVVLKDAERVSHKELEEWQTLLELLETKKLEMDIKSQLISEARVGFESAVENLIEDDRKEKEMLTSKGNKLAKELDELLALVRLKEAEIAENGSRIQDVDERISEVLSNFHDTQLNISRKHDELMVAFSEVETENEVLLTKKKEIDNFLSLAEEKRRKLMELSAISSDEAKVYQDVVHSKKCLASLILKSREDRVNFAKIEEKILEDIQILRQQVSAARSTLQELSSTRASIQQEIALDKQRIEFIEKRGPELEAEKKVAAGARNFKEAARVAAEAKGLNIEKEELQRKLDKSILDLEKLEKEIKYNINSIQESEGLIVLKEKEAAMASCKRLLSVAGAARAERSAALKMGDPDEGDILLKEAEAAELKARELQEIYDLEIEVAGRKFVSLAFIINLSAKDLMEMASFFYLPAANGL